jgi:DNA-binding GntR family transcriptional regulator
MLCRVSIPPVTRGAEVFDVLRAELLNGVLNPGDKLRPLLGEPVGGS